MEITREVDRMFYIFIECPDCNISMDRAHTNVKEDPITITYKCPKCGHSETSTNQYPLTKIIFKE